MGDRRTAYLSGKHYTHKAAWMTAEYLSELALKQEEGAAHTGVAAALFTFLALEGFLNFLGGIVAPDVWQNERKSFGRGSQYPGVMGKLDFLLDHCGVSRTEVQGPYETARSLKDMRHSLAHPRTEELRGKLSVADLERTPRLEAEYWTFGDEDFVRKAVADVELLADRIWTAACDKFEDRELRYHRRAFRGMIEQQGGSISS